MKKIFYEIWDTSGISNAIKSRRFSARIRVLSSPLRARADQVESARIRIKNIGGALWPDRTHSGRRLIRLGAQLFDKDRTLVELNYARAFLPHPLSANQSETINIELPALNRTGEFWLKFDMVSEGVDWFEPAGSKVIWARFMVS